MFRIFFIVFSLMLPAFAIGVDEIEFIEFEGEVGTVSTFPSPEEAPYPDCGYTFEVTVKGQRSGEMLPREVIMIGTAFTGGKLDRDPIAIRGERIRFKAAAFENGSEFLRTRQVADQLNAFDTPQYFVLSAERIDLFDPVWAAGYIPKIGELPHPPEFPFFERTDEQERDRAAFIRQDLEYLITLRDTLGGGNFTEWNRILKPLRDEYARQSEAKWADDTYFKSGGWVFGGTFEETESFRNAVLFMNQYLRDRNIDLIVIRIPGRTEICADLFNPEFKKSIVNPAYYELQKFLLENDVEYVELTRRMVEHRLDSVAPYWYIESGEGHAAEGGCTVVAAEIAERIRRYNIESDLPDGTSLVTIDGMYNYPAGNAKFNPSTPIPVNAVHFNGKPLPVAEDGKSEILLMGDSYFTHPSMREGATIQHYLAWQSRVVPDLLCRMSAGSGLPRFLSSKGDDFLAPRKVVVWVTKPDTVFKKIVGFAPPVYFKKKELLKTISGDELKTLDFTDFVGGASTSFYSDEDGGVFKILPLKQSDISVNGSGAAGKLTLDVSEFAGKSSALLISMQLGWNWTVACETVCGDYSDFSYLSLSDYSRKADYLVPLAPNAECVEFNYRSVKVLRGLTLTIRKIEIYAVEPGL